MLDIEDFMEEYYDYRPTEMLTLEEFTKWKEENGIEEWDYPLEEYKHISENDIICEPVRFADPYGGYEYRFCEVKEFEDEEETDNRDELREELEEYLNGLRIYDYITRKRQENIMADFDEWCKTSEIGDTYYYDGEEYTLKAI